MRPTPGSAIRYALLTTLLLFGAGKDAAAQEGCECGPEGCDVVTSQNLPGLGRVTYISGARLVCEGGVRIYADSAVAYGDRGYSELLGSVRYLEATREMLADEARYFTNEGRLQAEGGLSIRDDEQGSSIQNGSLVYLLATDFREREEMTVTTGPDGMRPVAVLRPPTRAEPSEADTADAVADTTDAVADTAAVVEDTAGVATESVSVAEPEPYTVVGDRIFLLGSGYFTASGTVEIVRDSLLAFADSAEYDEAVGALALVGAARVESSAYELTGRTILLDDPGTGSGEVRARREARLEGEDLLLTSAHIALFLVDDQLERLAATPLARPGAVEADSLDLERPRATVEGFLLTADSLEVLVPRGAVERVFASGTARSVSTTRDSLNVELLPEVARSDWLEGDSVVVTFLERTETEVARPPPEGADEARPPLEVDEIVAMGRARSLYRLPPNDSTARAGSDPPAVHYVVGDEIRVQMQDREVHRLLVVGQTRGVHLEPLRRVPPDSTTAPSDSAGAPPDTAAAPPDTGAIVGDTAAALAAPVRRGGFSPSQPRTEGHETAAGSPARPEEKTWRHP